MGKVVPDYGLLKLSNLPNEFSTASLKKELKKCLNCELSIKSLKDGDAEVIFRPKVFDIEQLLANLTIDEKNVGVELVKETKTIDKVVKLTEKDDEEKLEAPIMFGSTDIRERQKGVKRKQPSEAGNVWVRPTGESY